MNLIFLSDNESNCQNIYPVKNRDIESTITNFMTNFATDFPCNLSGRVIDRQQFDNSGL